MNLSKNLYTYFLILSFFMSCSTNKKMIHKESKIIGTYNDYFGDRIELNADSTFKFNYAFDLISSWSIGKWNVKSDTIYFETNLVMDTLTIRDLNNKIIRDSLVLSDDTKIDRIELIDNISSILSSGGQNRKKVPEKLFWKNNKLYRFDSIGRLDLRRVDGFWTNKKYNT